MGILGKTCIWGSGNGFLLIRKCSVVHEVDAGAPAGGMKNEGSTPHKRAVLGSGSDGQSVGSQLTMWRCSDVM